MSLGDLLGFELFNLGDMWKGIKKNPERLFLGAADPISSKMWGGILGKDYEPLIDQMGGPYGGHTISAFGNKDGGVYQRAEQAGIDTKTGGQVNDVAHVIAAILAGNYAMGKLPQGQTNQFGQYGQQPQNTYQPPPQLQTNFFEEARKRAAARQAEEKLRQQLAMQLGNYAIPRQG